MTAARWKGLSPFLLSEARVSRDHDLTLVPYFTAAGEEHNVRVHSTDGRCWWQESGRELIPYGLEMLCEPLDAHDRALLVGEGESDVIALRAFTLGYSHADYDGFDVLGVPGSSTWRPEWATWLRPYAAVYLFGDGDEAGRRMNDAIRSDVPRARGVELPEGRDVRSIVQEFGPDALDPLIDAAVADAFLEQAFFNSASLDELRRTLSERSLRAAA